MSSVLEKLKHQLSSETFIVVDIGNQNMKVMEIKRKAQNYYIQKAFTIPEMSNFFTGPDMFNINGIVEALWQITQLERVKSKNIVLSFSSGKLQTRIISVPDLPDKELRTFVELEYPKQFTNYNKITDVADYMPLGSFTKVNSNQKHLSVLLASYPAADGERLVKEFQNKKYKINIIDVDIPSLGNIGKIHNDFENEDIVVLNVGHKTSQMVFLKNQTIVLSRTLAFGTNTIIRAIQSQEDISSAYAESILREFGLHAQEDIEKENHTLFADDYNELIEEHLTNALNEAYRSFQSVNTNYGLNISNVLLTGGFSSIPYSKELSQKILEMDVDTWSIEKSEKLQLSNGISIINQTETRIDGLYATCIGMAIKGDFK